MGGRNARSVDVAFDANNTDSTGRYYGFTVPLSSVEMAQPVTATLHYGDGLSLEAGKAISAKGYVEGFDKVASSYDGETVALVHALADYGHWVQPFLSAANGWSLGDGDGQYAEMDRFYAGPYDGAAARAALAGYVMSKDVGGSAVEKASASLSLESETTLEVVLTVAEGVTPTVASATLGGRAVDVAAPARLGKASGGGIRWRVRVPGIRAWQLGEEVVVTGDADGGFSVSASGLAYAGAMLGVDSYAGNGGHDAMCALYAFHQAEVAYRSTH